MDKVFQQQGSVGGEGDSRDASAGPRAATAAAATIAAFHVFSPARILDAVKFHLLDEGIAAHVCPRSVERVLKRMERAALSVEISAASWRDMENHQRLQWLLVNSCTDYRVGASDGMAVLV